MVTQTKKVAFKSSKEESSMSKNKDTSKSVNSSLAIFEAYHIMRSFLDGDVESEEEFAKMTDSIEELEGMIPEEQMVKIQEFMDKLSELTYGDALEKCHTPEYGHFEESADGLNFKIDTSAQLELVIYRFMSTICEYRVALDRFTEEVLIPAM